MSGLRVFALLLPFAAIVACHKTDASAQAEGTSAHDRQSHVPQENADHVDQALLEESVALVNERLPMDVGNNTRVDKVTVGPGRRIVYHATLVNRDSAEQRSGDLSSGIPELIKMSCSRPSIQSFLDDGIAVTYKYKAADGTEITSIDVTKSLCVNAQGLAPNNSFKPTPLRGAA